MQALSPEKILAVWETGRGQHDLDRALTLLGAGWPELTWEELAGLSIGERDARLLRLRTAVFGPRAAAYAECPACEARVEMAIDTGAFAQPARDRTPELEFDGKQVRFRLPNSRDLAEIVQIADPEASLCRLGACCLLEPRDASPTLLEALSQAMLEAEPQAEITLALSCPECGHAWQSLFEIAAFFWEELAAEARRLLREVDALARAYGWSEREILALPARRRQSYLELIAA